MFNKDQAGRANNEIVGDLANKLLRLQAGLILDARGKKPHEDNSAKTASFLSYVSI